MNRPTPIDRCMAALERGIERAGQFAKGESRVECGAQAGARNIGNTMQALKAQTRVANLCLALLFACLLSGCGWRNTMTFRSPSGRSSIHVWQTSLASEFGIRVELVTPSARKELFARRRETLIHFVHVVWTADESRVAVFGTGSMSFGVAANINTGAEVPFEDLKKALAASIARTYDLPSGEDPLKWACLTPAFGAFARLHPEIHPSYF
jgi:hypothetical protein